MLSGLALILAVAITPPPYPRKAEPDPYSVEFVKHCFKAFRAGFRDASIPKHLPQLGDRAAIAVIKGFSKDEIENPHNLETLLAVIREAFSHPDLITVAQDKVPGATMYFLDCLDLTTKDPAVRQHVRDLRQFILVQLETMPSRGK